jgi:hypothetical protein
MTGVPESLIDEDEVIDLLIAQKAHQVKTNVQNPAEEEKMPGEENGAASDEDGEGTVEDVPVGKKDLR